MYLCFFFNERKRLLNWTIRPSPELRTNACLYLWRRRRETNVLSRKMHMFFAQFTAYTLITSAARYWHTVSRIIVGRRRSTVAASFGRRVIYVNRFCGRKEQSSAALNTAHASRKIHRSMQVISYSTNLFAWYADNRPLYRANIKNYKAAQLYIYYQ